MRHPVRESEWIAEFDKHLRRQKHIVLYGNVYDHCLFNGAYISVSEFLNSYFKDLGFEIIVRYDPVDRFVFPDDEVEADEGSGDLPKDERERFQALVSRRDHARLQQPRVDAVAGARKQAAEPATGDPTIPPASSAPVAQRPSSSVQPDEAFAQLRVALSSTASSCAGIVELADILTHQADHYSEGERHLLALLKKCTLEGALQTSGRVAGYRNTLVIVASELKRLPEWLYHDNPYVSLVHATRPGKEERKAFVQMFAKPRPDWSGFFGAESLTDADLLSVADELADLTEGFQAIDLNALRVSSHSEEIAVRPRQVRALVDHFKFGVKEDPWEKLDRKKVQSARDNLSKRVIGQPSAVDAVVSMLTTSKFGLTIAGGAQSGRPKGVFFFVGPTGVGKTELAKAVTELVFADDRAFARFDMSEYKEEHAAEKLAGSPPGFVGYEEGGQLTNRVITQPHSILLFDEIEKAHPRVLDKFLQILEDGRLTDGKGQTAYFNQTAIIFTSNIGASDSTDANDEIRPGIMPKVMESGLDQFPFDKVKSFFDSEVKHHFETKISRAELLNRLGDNIVVFDLLRPEYVRGICRKFLAQITQYADDRFGAKLVCEDSVVTWVESEMVKEDNQLYGGRRIKSLLEQHFERPLNEWLFTNYESPEMIRGKTIRAAMDSDGELQVSVS